MEFNKPKPLTFTKNNIRKDWQTWKEEFLIYLKLSGGYSKFTEEDRALLLINLMGTEGIKAMNDMTFDDLSEKNDMDILLMKFDNIFDPPMNEAEERFKFFSRKKKENESIQNFVTDLKEKVTACNFGPQSNKMIVDKLILNMDPSLRQIIFALEDVTLADVTYHYEMHHRQNEKIKEVTKNMKKTFKSDNPQNMSTQNSNPFNQSQLKQTISKPIEKLQPYNCSKCGKYHEHKDCPAYNNICQNCFNEGHYTSKCKQSKSLKSGNSENNLKVNYIPSNQEHLKQTTSKNYEKLQAHRICSKCGTHHKFRNCPAYNFICHTCFTKGHYTNKCKSIQSTVNMSKVSHDSKVEKNTTPSTTSNLQQTINKPFVNQLENCTWCETAHLRNQCPHNQNCTRCDSFPHKICFQCKKNPHDNNCYYKAVITLPLIAPASNRNLSAPKCLLCGNAHERSISCAPIHRVTAPRPTMDEDSFLSDYVNIEKRPQPQPSRPQSSGPQPSRPQSSGPQPSRPQTSYNKGTSEFSKSNYKKSNQKPDSCSIA